MMKYSLRVLICAMLMVLSLSGHAADRPNILMIVVDDLNDWEGCYGGHPQAHTPNIDRLAKQGVMFSNAHCQAPICKPSRDSFMTGKLPSTTGIYLLGGFHFNKSPALKDAKALPEHFAANGYETLGTGKLYHSRQGKETFETYGPGYSFGPRPKDKKNYKMGHPLWDWGEFPEKDAQLTDTQCTDWAVKQIKQKREKPYFMAVGLVRTHVPLYVPKNWWDRQPVEGQITLPKVMKNDTDDIPMYGLRLTAGFPAPRHEWMLNNPPQWERITRAYLACIDFVDHQVGRMLRALEESGQAENTVVVFFSDHGFHMGEKGRWAKRSLWEESTRVPLIIRGPGVEGDRVCRQPAGLIDLYPTLSEMAGLKQPGGLEGQSLMPQLKDVKTARRPTITTFWMNNHAIRSERYRYIRYADGSEELYDHERDPHEWRNLAKNPNYAPIMAEHRKYLPTVNAQPVEGNAALGVAPEDRGFFKVKN